jgi:hypothetical protein
MIFWFAPGDADSSWLTGQETPGAPTMATAGAHDRQVDVDSA